MSPDELQKYNNFLNDRKDLYFEQDEVKELQAKVKKLVGELKAQVDENNEEKGQLQAMWDKYDQKFQQHQMLEETNRQLNA